MESFENEKLHFFYSIEDCIKSYDVDVVLLSSVLHYLEEPYQMLDRIIQIGIKYIIIDRTPFLKGTDRITIQKVNPKIYKASYPCWFLNKKKFISFLDAEYNLVLEFDAHDKANISSEFKGIIFDRKK